MYIALAESLDYRAASEFRKNLVLLYTIREEFCNAYANVDIVSTEFSPLVTGLLTDHGSTIEARVVRCCESDAIDLQIS